LYLLAPSALSHNLEALMDLVLRGVVIGMFCVIGFFTLGLYLKWHEEKTEHTIIETVYAYCEKARRTQ
jgi:hypothetical protein